MRALLIIVSCCIYFTVPLLCQIASPLVASHRLSVVTPPKASNRHPKLILKTIRSSPNLINQGAYIGLPTTSFFKTDTSPSNRGNLGIWASPTKIVGLAIPLDPLRAREADRNPKEDSKRNRSHSLDTMLCVTAATWDSVESPGHSTSFYKL